MRQRSRKIAPAQQERDHKAATGYVEQEDNSTFHQPIDMPYSPST